VKWQALRNRVAAIQAKLPGPHTVLTITGGLPPGATAQATEKSPPTTTAAAPPVRAAGKATGLLKAARTPTPSRPAGALSGLPNPPRTKRGIRPRWRCC
jgi:hypothetical protein